MPRKTSYFKIGLFTIIALTVLSIGIITLGLGSIFKSRVECETFFSQSVQGLTVGSPINFRGFKVGQVTSISLSQSNSQISQKLVKVDFYLDPDLIGDRPNSIEEVKAFLANEIQSGLRVYLSFQGVTGVSFLDLDYQDNATPPPPWTGPVSDRLNIPNTPGTVMEIGASISHIVKSFKEVDFAELGQKLQKILTSLDSIANSLNQESGSLLKSMTRTVNDIDQTTQKMGTLINEISEGFKTLHLQSTATDLGASIKELRQLLVRSNQIIKSPQVNLPVTMDNLRLMSENLLELSELIKKYPSQVLFGQPPQKVNPYAPQNDNHVPKNDQ